LDSLFLTGFSQNSIKADEVALNYYGYNKEGSNISKPRTKYQTTKLPSHLATPPPNKGMSPPPLATSECFKGKKFYVTGYFHFSIIVIFGEKIV
jgi:hypothetical protein